MGIFEYIFYRVAKFYYKSDGSTAIRAVGVISVIQGMLLVDIFIILQKLTITVSASMEYVRYGKTIGGVLAIALMIFNYLYFKDKYWKLSDRWKEKEDRSRYRFNGILVVIAIVAPFVILILLGTAFGRT